MTKDADGFARRLHGVFERFGLIILTLIIGSKRAGQEHLQTHRVATGGMVVGAAICAGLVALLSVAGGVAAQGVIAVATGVAFFGAFLGIFAALVLRVLVGFPPGGTSTRDEAGPKEKRS